MFKKYNRNFAILKYLMKGKKMRKNRIKELTVLCVLSLLGRPAPAYAGWNFQDGLWRYEEQDGSLMSGWLQEADQWYYFEADGHLATGWKEIEGFWYFFNPVSDGSLGRMMTGWQWIDGKCYYLAEVSVDGHERGVCMQERRLQTAAR